MKKLISSVKVETIGSHDRVSVWNRGGLAGTLLVCGGDGAAIAARLEGPVEPPPIAVGSCGADLDDCPFSVPDAASCDGCEEVG